MKETDLRKEMISALKSVNIGAQILSAELYVIPASVLDDVVVVLMRLGEADPCARPQRARAALSASDKTGE